MDFEWDENKNKKNIEKHKIDFNIAKQIFYNNDNTIIYDLKHSLIEKRFLCFGFVEEKFLCVVFTYRDKSIRIISARYASKKERREYGNS